MLLMQLLGWQSYLLQNTLGSPIYPPGTNVSRISENGAPESHSVSAFLAFFTAIQKREETSDSHF